MSTVLEQCRRVALLGCLLLAALPACAVERGFSFAVAATPGDESMLRAVLADTDADNLAFVVAQGVKAPLEPCSDELYASRRALFDAAKNGVVVSLVASDWSACPNGNGRSVASERLNKLREAFFADEFSLGSSRIPLQRQSTMPKFRNYAENVRWEFGDVLFATVNLPANNNHYLTAAGRNSEFEDRQIANSDWLQRLFAIAKYQKHAAIVIFCDGNPFAQQDRRTLFDLDAKRDGFAEIRRQIGLLASKYGGKVLLVTSRQNRPGASPAAIVWRENLGLFAAAPDWQRVTVNPATATLFSVTGHAPQARYQQK